MKNNLSNIVFGLLLLLAGQLSAQCVDADASIWQNTWASCQERQNPNSQYGNSHWIQYDFGITRGLSKTWVWNTNDPTALNQGFKTVRVDYSEDGQNWTSWGEMEFPRGTGEAVYSGFSGPDLQNIKARYVLLTAMSNHGNTNCFGLAEVKFNLMPIGSEGIPNDNPNEEDDEEETEDDEEDDDTEEGGAEDEDEEDDDTEEGGAEDEPITNCIAPEEIIVEEVFEDAAFLFWEIEEEQAFLIQYRIEDNGNILEIETDEPEIFLEDLRPNTTYEYRVGVICEEDMLYSEIGTFTTTGDENCMPVEAINLEEVSRTEAFFTWESEGESWAVRFGREGQDVANWDYVETDEPEVFLEDLRPRRDYLIQIGVICGGELIWSEEFWFFTSNNFLDRTSSIDATNSRGSLNLSEDILQIFPNPTKGILHLNYRSQHNELLNYSISDIQGKVLYRGVTQLNKGNNMIELDMTRLSDGIYLLNTLTLNHRKRYNRKIVKTGLD